MTVAYAGSPLTGGQSPRIWGDCPWTEINEDPGRGFTYAQGFESIRDLAASSGSAQTLTGTSAIGSLALYVDATGGTALIAAGRMSVLALVTSDEDNNASILGLGNGVHGPIELAADRKLWFEARVGVLSIASTYSAFVGLGSIASLASGGLQDSATTILHASSNAAGFARYQHATVAEPWDAVHTIAGTADTALAASIHTAVAAADLEDQDDFFNLGLRFDGASLHYYVNNALVASVLRTATNFPAATSELTALFGIATRTTTAYTLLVDWFKVAHERV